MRIRIILFRKIGTDSGDSDPAVECRNNLFFAVLIFVHNFFYIKDQESDLVKSIHADSRRIRMCNLVISQTWRQCCGSGSRRVKFEGKTENKENGREL